MTVAALYVNPNGVYAGLPDVELWGEERDARQLTVNYHGVQVCAKCLTPYPRDSTLARFDFVEET